MPPKTKTRPKTTKPEKPPVNLVGTVDDTYLWGGILADVLEHVPDLAWPTSVETYSHMRRDPQLTAVIDGYSLQLRRAQWQLDGRGCRPEVVKLVADDLGLSVADSEEEPTGARTRGVSWNEHLRAALLSLIYGHMPFEIGAEIRDGKARLAVVAERMPHTIEQIHIDTNTGALKGITQRLGKHLGVPEIDAKNLVWYAHNREGISWQGTSLLRPAYGSWLFKREMIRAHAIANRRWSAGVPTMEALPGTVATTAQMEQAQRMASAARAGDQAGVAVPPGFRFIVAGVTGSLPDTLGFIKWLDQQMSRAALMGHLDLGETANGSRALGQSFIDYLILSLEAIGEHIADVATRQMAARIVAWNWGEDEPVPLIRAAGVGSRRDVTAESLQMLMVSGALSADPGLEEWIRKEYRLPERTEPRADSQEGKKIAMDMSIELAKATKPEPGAPGAAGKPGVPAKPGDKAKTSDKKTPVGVKPGKATPKTAVKAAADDGGEADVLAATPPASVTDLDQLEAQHRAAVAGMSQQFEDEAHPIIDAIIVLVLLYAGKSLAKLGNLAVKTAAVTAVADVIAVGLLGLAALASAQMSTELGLMPRPLPVASRRRITQLAQATVSVVAQGMASGASREALRRSGTNADPEAVAAAVRVHLAELVAAKPSGLVADALIAAATAAQGEGRRAALEELPVGWQLKATESLDRSACGPCKNVNGRVYESLAAALEDYPHGAGYHACEGRHRCRGQLEPIPPSRE
jgi:hypothetical protein